MKTILAAALAAATALPLTGLTAAPAFAGSPTVIREYKAVAPDQPTLAAPAPQTTQARKVVHRTTVRRRATTQHVVHHAVTAPRPVANSATTGSVDTSATVREDSDMPASAYRSTDGVVMEERKTVIRRDDDGNVTRRTRVIRQGPEGGMTAVEHSSSEGPDYDDTDHGPATP